MKTEINQEIAGKKETDPSKKTWATPSIVLIEKHEIEKTNSVGEVGSSFS